MLKVIVETFFISYSHFNRECSSQKFERSSSSDMGWPQPKSPIQTDNSTPAGVTNKTIVTHRNKMMDMQY